MISTEWYRHDEGRTMSHLAFDPNLATVQAHQFLHERETDSRTLVSAAALTFDAMESFEHARQLRFGNADTAVFHNQHCVGTIGVDCNLDPAVQRKFEARSAVSVARSTGSKFAWMRPASTREKSSRVLTSLSRRRELR